MDLNSIAAGVVAAVNPPEDCTLKLSVGYSVTADYSQVPIYTEFYPVACQIQPLSGSDLIKLGALNIQVNQKAIYLEGDIEGVSRADIKGGDLFVFPNGSVWLVTRSMENWPDWSKVAVTQQNGG